MEYVDFISGEIRSYENGVGKIISKEEEYIFNDDDLENGPIVIGDKVYFRPEEVNDIKGAFFVFKIDDMKKEVLENEEQR